MSNNTQNMNYIVLVFFLFATFGDTRSQEPCLDGNCAKTEPQGVNSFSSSHNSWHDLNEREIFNTTCRTMIKGDLYKGKWRWQARFWCPSLSEIEGYSKNQDIRGNATERALDDYIRKGKQLGFLTPNLLQDSLDIQSNSIYSTIELKSRHTRDLTDKTKESSLDGKPMKIYTNGIYKGDLVNDQEHGVGLFVWNSGNKYIGMWRNGDMHGIGVYIFANGIRYVGQFQENVITGYGIMTFPSGYVYKGDFVEGERSGYGEESWTSGDKYIGQFKNDKRNGFGYWFFATGKRRAAFYVAGEEI